MIPLLLLDVDGVLNAITPRPDLEVWPDWRSGHSEADGVRWRIRFSPTVIGRLRGWHEQQLVELSWLTTWGHNANGELRGLLGLPKLAVAGTPDDKGSASDLDAASLAGTTAAAPDELTGQWWKLDVVRRIRSEQPDRSLLWVDDELRGQANPFADWAAAAGIVAVGPKPEHGLTASDLEFLQTALGTGSVR